ncbi:MAG: hypothetical protein EP330_23050 [Deltaproteobacteria bacterium]|nr:MAG: hypothetical protein EP330_23050 [Deltaproteobacteria bacterium]
MLHISLLLGLAIASETEVPAEPAPDEPVAAEERELPPWREYRLRNVLYPHLDTEFLDQWEPAFRQRNRMAGASVGLLIGGVGLGVAGLIADAQGNPGGVPTAAVGGVLAFAAPLVGIHGTLGAARILRASGTDVTRVWAWSALGLLTGSLILYPALVVTVPAATLLTLVQAEVNGSAFRRVMNRPPQGLFVVLPGSAGRAGLTLAAAW